MQDPIIPTRNVTASAILTTLDAGEGLAPISQALLLLRLADPAGHPARHADLPIAQRDLRLIDLHLGLFGRRLTAAHDCAACGEQMELLLDGEGLRAALADAAERTEIEMTVGDARLCVRQASSADLLASLDAASPDARRACLLGRCVRRLAEPDGDAGAFLALPSVLRALDGLHEAAELRLNAACPACSTGQLVTLDIASFLWTELRRQGALLLDDVHDLASAYGWSEQAILAMPASRRTAYLDRLRA